MSSLEVKSINSRNEVGQLQKGLGQLLHNRFKARAQGIEGVYFTLSMSAACAAGDWFTRKSSRLPCPIISTFVSAVAFCTTSCSGGLVSAVPAKTPARTSGRFWVWTLLNTAAIK